MNRILQRRIPGRRAAVLAALLLLAVPAAAWFQRTTVYFLASFNVPGAPNTNIVAEVGQFNPTTPPPTFVVVPNGSGGQLEVADTGTTADAKLDAIFNAISYDSYLVITWRMQAMQANSGLIFRVDDSGEQGILDCNWDGGNITVNGAPTTSPYDAGSSYDVTLRLSNTLPGVLAWQLELREGGMLVSQSAGVIGLGKPLSVKQLEIIRPAGEPAGTFFVDEIKAASYDFAGK